MRPGGLISYHHKLPNLTSVPKIIRAVLLKAYLSQGYLMPKSDDHLVLNSVLVSRQTVVGARGRIGRTTNCAIRAREHALAFHVFKLEYGSRYRNTLAMVGDPLKAGKLYPIIIMYAEDAASDAQFSLEVKPNNGFNTEYSSVFSGPDADIWLISPSANRYPVFDANLEQISVSHSGYLFRDAPTTLDSNTHINLINYEYSTRRVTQDNTQIAGEHGSLIVDKDAPTITVLTSLHPLHLQVTWATLHGTNRYKYPTPFKLN